MSSTSISSVLASTLSATNSTSAVKSTSTEQDEFMILLLAQLQNQNPLEPMDSTEMMSQLAQLNSLTALNSIKASLAELNRSQSMSYAAGLIGKTVAYIDPSDNTKSLVGLVDSTTSLDSGIFVQVDGKDIEVTKIIGVTEG